MASAAKYLSNVAKSVKYASIDVLKSYNPVIVDAVETNEDVSKAVYTGIKNYRQIYSKTKSAIQKSEIGELAGELKNNLISDLKSGKFYNKERESRAMSEAVMGADLGFGDEDFGFGDDDLGFGDDSDMGFDEEPSIADTLDSVGERASNAINNVSVRSAEYQVEANRQSTNKIMGHLTVLSSQLHGDLSAINANVANVMDFQANAMATHMENSKTFYETQQRQMDEQTSILREILENQQKIAGVGNGRGSSYNSDKVTVQDLFSSEGAIDLKAYLKYAKQNATDSGSEIGDMISMIKELNLGKALVANPVGMLTSGAIKSFMPKALKSAFQEMNDTIAGSFSTALLNLTKAKDSDNSILSFLGNIFGLDLSPKKSISTSNYEKGPVPWTGKDHKALTDVIPTLLGKIYSSVSGAPDLIYDYDNGKFTTRNAIEKQYKNARNRYVVQANDSIMESLDEQIQKISFGNAKEKKQFLDDLEKVMEYNFEHMEKFNPNDKSLSAKTYGITGAKADYNMDLIRAIYSKIPESKQLRNQTDLIDAVNSLNSWMKGLEQSADSPFLKMNDDFEKVIEEAGGRKKTNPQYDLISGNLNTATDYLKRQVEISTSQTAILNSIVEEIQNNGAISIDNTISNIKTIHSAAQYLHTDDNPGIGEKFKNVIFGKGASKKSASNTSYDFKIGDLENGFYEKLIARRKSEEKERERRKSVEDAKARERENIAAQSLKVKKQQKADIEGDKNNNSYSNGLGLSTSENTTMEYGSDINLDDPNGENKNESDFIKRARKTTKASDKLKLVLKGGIPELLRLPLYGASALIRKADKRVYDLFFGSEKSDGEESITEKLTDGFDDFFDTIKERARDKIDDIKDMLTDSDFKGKITEAIDKIFGIDSGKIMSSVKEALFGDKNKGLFEGIKDIFVDGAKDMWKDTKDFWKPATDTIKGVKTEAGQAKDDQVKATNTFKDKLRQGLKKDKDLNSDGTGEREPAFGAFSDIREEDRKKEEEENKKSKKKNRNRKDKAASGIDRVSKTGVVAVSKGELILPPDMNPFNIKRREKNEDKQIRRFKDHYNDIDLGIPKFAKGGPVDDKTLLKQIFGTDDFTKIDMDTVYDKISKAVPDPKQREKLINRLASIADKTRKANRTTRGDYVEGEESLFTKMGDEFKDIVKGVKDSKFVSDIVDKYHLGGKDKKDGKTKEIIEDTAFHLSDYMPGIAKGGMAGAFMSLFLPVIGLPLGTALGASVGLVSKSEAIQNMLFGKMTEDGERDGSGILSKDLSKKITKYFPNMSKGAIAGAITSILPFVPGGPVTGIMLGSAIGFARTNEDVKNALFGEGKFLNKAGNYIKEKLPKMGLGAAASLVVGGPFGILGNMAVGAGVGLISDTDKFQTMLLGHPDEAGERHGGVVGFVKDALQIPLDGIKHQAHKTIEWFDETFVKNAGNWFNTIAQSIDNSITSIRDMVADHIKTKIVTPIGKVVKEKVMKPVQKFFGFFGKLGMGLLRNTIGAPFTVFNNVMTKVQEKQLATVGKADRMTATQRQARREQLIAKNNKKGQVRAAIGDFLGYDLFGIQKQRREYADRLRGSESAKADEYMNSLTTDELEKIVAKQKKIDPRALSERNQKMSGKKFGRAQMSNTGLDRVITSNIDAGRISLKYAKSLSKALKNNDYDTIRNILNSDDAYYGQNKNDLLKAVDDAEAKSNAFTDNWDKSIERAKKLEEETGISGIGGRRAQSSFEKELNRRKGAESRGEKTGPEAKEETTAEAIQDLDINKKHDQVVGILEKIEDALLHIAFPDQFENEPAKGKKKQPEVPDIGPLYVDPTGVARNEEQEKAFKEQQQKQYEWNQQHAFIAGTGYNSYATTPEDRKLHAKRAQEAVNVDMNGEATAPESLTEGNVKGDKINVSMSVDELIENGYTTEAKNLVKKSGFLSRTKNKILSTISKIGRKSNQSKSVITAMGPIKTRIDNQGNEIPDERDSETKNTLRKQTENDNTQKGILSRITDLTSHFKLFTGGEKEDKKKPSLLSKILKGVIFGAGLVPKIATGIGALAVAGMKVNTKKRNSKGEVITDGNGNPIMEKKPLIQAIVEAGQRVWMGDDLTGKTNGMYFHLKSLMRDKILPAAGTAVDYLLKLLPKAIESGTGFISKYLPSVVESFTTAIVKNFWPILKSFGKGIIKGIIHKDESMDSSEMDGQVAKLRDSNLTLGNTGNSSNSSGDKVTKAMQTAFDSSTSVSVSTGTATGSNTVSTNKNNTISSSNTSTSSTTSGTTTSTGNVTGSKPNKSNNKDVKKSKAYQNAPKQTKKEALDQLSGIWNQKLQSGQSVSELLNDDETVIADVDTGNGKTYGITGADLLNYPDLAQQVLGINISSLTNEERNENTRASGDAPNREHQVRDFWGRTASRAARTVVSGGKNMVLVGGATKAVGGTAKLAGKVLSKAPLKSVKAVGKGMEGLGSGIKAVGYGWTKLGDISRDVANGKTLWTATKDAAKDAWDTARGVNKKSFTQKAKSGFNRAKDVASKVKDKVSNIRNGAESVTGKAADVVEHFGLDDVSVIDKTGEEIYNSAKQAANKPKLLETVENASSKAADVVEHFKPDEVMDAAGNSIAKFTKAADTAEDVASVASTAVGAVDKGASSSKFVQMAAKTEQKALGAAKAGGKLTGKAAELVSKFKTLISKFFTSSTFMNKLSKVLSKVMTADQAAGKAVEKAIKGLMEKLTTKFSTGIAGAGAKTISKIAGKYASFFGSAGFTTAAFATKDFIKGWNYADVTFKVKKPTWKERIMSAILQVLCGTFCLDIIISREKLSDMIVDFLESAGVDMSDLRDRQDELDAEVKEYNTTHGGKNLSAREYLEKDKLGTKIKKAFNGVWDHITGKDDKDKDDDKKSSKKDKKSSKKNNTDTEIPDTNVTGTDYSTTYTEDTTEDTGDNTDATAAASATDYSALNMNVTGTDYSVINTSTNEDSAVSDDITNANVTGTTTQSDDGVDPVQAATSGVGSVINQSNQAAIQSAYTEINQSIPDMITTVKSNLASFFGLSASDLSRTTQVGKNKYKGKGPTAIFNKLANMWRMTTTLTNPMMSILPKAMASGMKSLSRFMAISLGMASPDDQNIDFTKIVNDQGYLNTRAKRISESSAFYELFGGVSGNNSNDSSKQEQSAAKNNSSSSKTKKSSKKSPIKSAFKKIASFFTGSGSGMEDIDDTGNVDESKFDPNAAYFVSQKYGRYASTPFSVTGDTTKTTVADAGCAPAVASMAVNATGLSKPLDMSDAIKDAIKYKKPNQGVSADYFIDEFSKHNIDSSYITPSNSSYEDTVKGRLKDNRPVILMGTDPTNTDKRNSPFGPQSHYVVATKMDNDGTVYINDPEARKPNKKYDFNTIIKDTKLGILPSMKSGNRQGSSMLIDKLKKALGGYSARGKYGPDTVQYKVWNAVRAAGYNEISTAALMGNIEHESGFNCGTEQVGGNGYGLIQWDGNRKPAMIAYCKSKGKPSNDPQCQIEYLISELNNKSMWMKASQSYNLGSLTRDDWANGKDIETATKALMCCFERPAYSASVNHIDRRIKSAKEYYAEFTGTAIDSSISSSGGDGSTEGTTTEKKTLIDQIIDQFTQISAAYGLTTSDDSGTTTTDSTGGGDDIGTDGITGNTVKDEGLANKQRQLVAKMKSKEGKLKYSWGPGSKYPGPSRNPDDGYGDCSSTVQWAYQNVLGVDPGNNTWAQETNSNTYTAATSIKDEKKLQLGDLLLKNGHVEMYAGNGKMIGHGGGSNGQTPGPTVKKLGNTPPFNLVRRWKGFEGKGSGLDDTVKDISWAGSDSGYSDSTPVMKYRTQPVQSSTQTTTTTSVNNQLNTTKKSDDSYAKLLELLIKLLAQVVDNTGSIKDIASLLVKIVDMKSESSATSSKEITDVKRDLYKTKASLTSMMADVAQSQNNQSLEALIRSVEAIAAQ